MVEDSIANDKVCLPQTSFELELLIALMFNMEVVKRNSAIEQTAKQLLLHLLQFLFSSPFNVRRPNQNPLDTRGTFFSPWCTVNRAASREQTKRSVELTLSFDCLFLF